MPAKITLRRASDGLERVVTDEYSHDAGGAIYQWTDGNYGCDCNRHLFFERAVAEPPDDEERPCGETLYEMLSIEIDGEAVWSGPERAT